MKLPEKTKTFLLILGIIILNSQCKKSTDHINDDPEFLVDGFITIVPQVYDKAFPNPLKGFRAKTDDGSQIVSNTDYTTLIGGSVKWHDIENSVNDGVEKIVEYTNKRWGDLPKRNIKVILRVRLEVPYWTQNQERSRDTVFDEQGRMRFSERYWPADMVPGDYSSEQFKSRLAGLIEKMGKAWDNDPRVAFINMGLIGYWGEQHNPSINSEMEVILGESFMSAFKTKLITVRQADEFKSYPFGIYWDSFAHTNRVNPNDWMPEGPMLIAQGDKWKTSVRGGEVAYDWGDLDKTGTSPNESLKVKAYRDHIIEWIRKVHCTELGWISQFNAAGDIEIELGADEVQRNLGYRFVLDEFTYNPEIIPGDSLKVKFAVTNVGSAPFYYNWPVEISLLNPDTKQKIWKAIFQDLDIRKWLPGDQWDPTTKKYLINPEKNIINEEFVIPDNIIKGEYILALSILDPAGNVPAVRFAIKNYYNGGIHPMGKIAVDKKLRSYSLNKVDFDNLFTDRSLYYEYNSSAN